ncbi:hypothetical protein A2W67_02505 [Candidatus Nomurabacteria bacterium RIFCSPLOWO2_02_40_28]|uniref:Uncharacterized protein n=2 Tax=Candidatus Nomuraibacteriota TaxID=1752729 RepID=A0A837HU67_9BACT|nr:MAG: hypothetical protein UT27_C0007G0008 [Candidatus Nomurabacteria bacterium GW2011_GWD2_39_12]KKR20353.1 MAG: hypothetical protein UT51_C0004G0012 [Candidatus Nomurabacteria bacterium GW2011_GWC2_39_41]KKR37070.1 MAG: hypothetical protein UT70_C0003G0012 [Candidatus Nomurabacteria bacterium GW2011_GWE2_40_10]KKR38319.1 MAG: hypothetical protein UT73_C0004G0064 [Candidatus Nomurabacteria bacterium GW2011_GWB1_40_11]KKR39795.1 MAG: hypothetical protein UT74_C0005G0012 [Parcubacteria group b
MKEAIKKEVVKESMQGFETPEFKRLHSLIIAGSEEINRDVLVKAREKGDIDNRDFNILVVKLLERTELELKVSKAKLEKLGFYPTNRPHKSNSGKSNSSHIIQMGPDGVVS